MNKKTMGWTALTVAVLIVLNEGLAWAGWLNCVGSDCGSFGNHES